MSALEGIRLFFGALFISLLPGLTWSFVLFRQRSIDWLERTAISLGLSIAIVPAAVFWLHWLLGMGISVLAVTLTAAVLTVAPAGYLVFRHRHSYRRILAKLGRLRRATNTPPTTPADSPP